MVDSSRYQHILVPLDGSGWSQRALPHAVDIARATHAEIILLHVFSPSASAYVPELALAGQSNAISNLRDDAARYLQGVAAELREAGIPCQVQIIDHADVTMGIAEFVRQSDVDLIVMSTHGRTGLSRLIFGSVAKGVMEQIGVPTLLVHPNEEK